MIECASFRDRDALHDSEILASAHPSSPRKRGLQGKNPPKFWNSAATIRVLWWAS